MKPAPPVIRMVSATRSLPGKGGMLMRGVEDDQEGIPLIPLSENKSRADFADGQGILADSPGISRLLIHIG
jgi:hypothetical protein